LGFIEHIACLSKQKTVISAANGSAKIVPMQIGILVRTFPYSLYLKENKKIIEKICAQCFFTNMKDRFANAMIEAKVFYFLIKEYKTVPYSF